MANGANQLLKELEMSRKGHKHNVTPGLEEMQLPTEVDHVTKKEPARTGLNGNDDNHPYLEDDYHLINPRDGGLDFN